MKKLFVENIGGELITLDEEQSRHIAKSLRMNVGDMITVCVSVAGLSDTKNVKMASAEKEQPEETPLIDIFRGLLEFFTGFMSDFLSRAAQTETPAA